MNFSRSCFVLILFLFELNVLAQQQATPDLLFQQAEKLFNLPNPTAKTDSLAIVNYLKIIKALKDIPSNMSMILTCYEHAGILKQELGLELEAIKLFKQAINLAQYHNLDDSLLYAHFLETGNSYYFLHKFDSSKYFLEKAEQSKQSQQDAHLFNSIGVLHFEAGNYVQSINHFSKALNIIAAEENPDKIGIYSVESNIASALRHYELYDSAAIMYKKLLKLGISTDDININLGVVYLKKNDPDSALLYLGNVKDSLKRKSIVYQNKLGKAFFLGENNQLAEHHLKIALSLAKEVKFDRIGNTYKLLGEIYQDKNDYQQALIYFQKAIIQLDNDFNDEDVLANPASFQSGFSSFLLFEALVAKAICFYDLYNENQQQQYLKSSVNTFGAAFKMADFISKSFDNDDARLFIAQKVFKAYQKAIKVLLEAYNSTRNHKYLHVAFSWAEKSKASTLSISLKENEIKKYADLPNSLLVKERNLKFNLSRLFLKMDKAQDDNEIRLIKAELLDVELALSKLQNQLHEYPEYFKQKFKNDSVSVNYIQQNIIKKSGALLSYFYTSHEIILFVLTQKHITYYSIAVDDRLSNSLQYLENELRFFNPGMKYKGSKHAKILYNKLIEIAIDDLKNISSLIIIPHQKLNNLPFEVLESEAGHYLLMHYDIGYQYAASFLNVSDRNEVDLKNAMVITPFNSLNAEFKSDDNYLPLHYSETEAKLLNGMRLYSTNATKDNFLKYKDSVSIIHLATHALANSEDPSRSYIAFHPNDSTEGENKLYSHELYNTSLDQTQLAFLSACETGTGKLISGEGIMSLSRAFAYAGCPNIVTSMWKAEDYATAFISQRFYQYVEENYAFSEALRLAKIDLISNPKYAQFHSPSYWSHLVFIGDPQQSDNSPYSFIIMAIFFVMVVLIITTHHKDRNLVWNR